MENRRNMDVRTIAGVAMLTAIVAVLQLVGATIRFGTFSISLVLLPIVIGSALYGPRAGAWLGGVFGLVVLLSGDANAFMSLNPWATVLVVLLKGILTGLLGGLVYRALEKKSEMLAAYGAAVTVPVVNTGVFILGCLLFFVRPISENAGDWGYGGNALAYVLTVLVGLNFFVELGANILLAPVMVRLIKIIARRKA